MVFAALTCIGLVMLAAKCLWNIAVPYVSHRRHKELPKGSDTSVSLHILLDFVFLFWTVLFAILTNGAYLFWGKIAMIAMCFSLPVTSYVCLTAFGVLLRKLDE